MFTLNSPSISKPAMTCECVLSLLQILTPNTDASLFFTGMTGRTKHMNVFRRNWRSVREGEEAEDRWRTVPRLHLRSPAAAPQRWTFTTALEEKASTQSSGMGSPAPTSRLAREETESREVMWGSFRGLLWFCCFNIHNNTEKLSVVGLVLAAPPHIFPVKRNLMTITGVPTQSEKLCKDV